MVDLSLTSILISSIKLRLVFRSYEFFSSLKDCFLYFGILTFTGITTLVSKANMKRVSPVGVQLVMQ